MKYLKKFNESVKDDFFEWVRNNINYTKDDILYYFSEFTDEFEYDYDVNLIQSNSMLDRYVEFEFIFSKDSNDFNVSISDKNIKEELRSFLIYLNQFKSIEPDIKDVKDSITTIGSRVSIIISFKKIIPKEISDKFSKDFNDEFEKYDRTWLAPNRSKSNRRISAKKVAKKNIKR